MSEFLPGVGPVYTHQTEIIHQPIAQDQVPGKPTPPLTPEQVKALDAAMTHDRDGEAVAGLIGLWSGGMLLKDLAKEHFHLPEDEDDDPEGPKEMPELPEE
jgi:hypothetical protein